MNRGQLIEKATDKFEQWDAPSWDEDPVARDAAVRWHLRGVQDALAVFEEAHALTDDERGALARIIWNADDLDRAVLADAEAIADRILAAGFRRTVQGEPSDDGHLITDCEHGVNSLYDRCAPCEVIERLEDEHLPHLDRLGGDWNQVARDIRDALAALRAASAVQGENR